MKVYLIEHSSGSYEDYRRDIVDAYVNKEEAVNRLSQLKQEFKLLRDEINSLQNHVFETEHDDYEECEICERYFDKSYEIEEHNGYYLKELEVRECKDGEFGLIQLRDYNKQ